MPADNRGFSPAELRHLLHCRTLAAERYRATLARTLGLSDTEAAALAHFASHGQLTPRELGDLLGLTSGGTTALIQRLEGAGHIARHPHPRDGRSVLLTATPAIVARAEDAYAPLVNDLDDVAARLTDEERDVVGGYLREVATVSERHADRLNAAVRADAGDVVAQPAPGLWA